MVRQAKNLGRTIVLWAKDASQVVIELRMSIRIHESIRLCGSISTRYSDADGLK